MSACLFAQGFHNSGTVPNPQDLAPRHSGTVFGVMNGIGCIPGNHGLRDSVVTVTRVDSASISFNVNQFLVISIISDYD